ncbi:MAG: lysylphosphatidylglycerol synthase transmembrane domain-containing protein [Acidobacteriota bacterium]
MTAPPESPRPQLEHLGRRLMLPAVLGVLALVGLALVADARDLARSLRSFDPWLLVPVLILSLVNYGLRFVRWQIYLRRLEVSLPMMRSLAIFLVGFLLSVTPGKAGELGKAWLVRELGGGQARRVVPAVLAERVTDLLGVILLLAVGALAFPAGGWMAAGGVAVVIATAALLSWRRAARGVFSLAGRLPRVGRHVHHLEEMYEGLRQLASPAMMTVGLLLSAVAWGAEGIGFLIVARGYAPEMGLFASLFDYGASTLAGALSMLPGGLLASEGTLAALLGSQGLTTADAASATLIIRVATLWFAVFWGLLALPWVLRQVRRKSPA